ncbi:MAG: leucine-rich repeat domain-containing protein [Treponema sp.]|jgi:hypothetical protein|nr:leucine-rich repeat domain-containing protein [Treponema sp.]
MNEKYDDERDFRIEPSEDGKSAVIVRYIGKKQTVIIPPIMHGLPISGIGNSAFKEKEIIRITIPDSVTSIGDEAFKGNLLIIVTIPEGVTSIGNNAFANCDSLTSITIPESVTSIGDMAFYGCSRLTSITIPESVTSIGWEAFSGCTSIIVASGNPNYSSEGGRLHNKDEKYETESLDNYDFDDGY